MDDRLTETERLVLIKLQESKNGLSTKEITEQTPLLTPEERVKLINRLVNTGDVEMCSIEGTNTTILRYRKSSLPAGSTTEEQLVCSFNSSIPYYVFRSIH